MTHCWIMGATKNPTILDKDYDEKYYGLFSMFFYIHVAVSTRD